VAGRTAQVVYGGPRPAGWPYRLREEWLVQAKFPAGSRQIHARSAFLVAWIPDVPKALWWGVLLL